MEEIIRKRTSEETLNKCRIYILDYLLKYTNENNLTNITKTSKYLVTNYNINLNRETISKIFRDLYSLNNIFKGTFLFEIKKTGNGKKQYYYTERSLSSEEINELCLATNNYNNILPRIANDIIEKLKGLFTIYDDYYIKSLESTKKDVSKYSDKFEDILKKAKQYCDECKKVKIKYNNNSFNRTFLSNKSNIIPNRLELEGYIKDILLFFDEPYLKIASSNTNKSKNIALFDINSIEEVFDSRLKIENSNDYNETKIMFCLENNCNIESTLIRFKESIRILCENNVVEKWIVFVNNKIENKKSIEAFDFEDEARKFYMKKEKNIFCSVPEKRKCYICQIDENLFIKLVLDTNIWPYIIIISPQKTISRIGYIINEYVSRFKNYY